MLWRYLGSEMNWKFLILLLGFATSALAVIDPPGCDLGSGGLGNTSVGGINFPLSQAHVGDTVSVVPLLGMVVNACRTINATGTVYISTGPLTNFMDNITLDPDGAHTCPADPLCTPGPYSFTITAPMVGAAVVSPNGTRTGGANAVRAVENGFGTVNSGIVNEQLIDFHSASITIVNPCIQVFKVCGTNCIGAPVEFTGYVTNCGDINLTNVNVVDDRTASLFEPDGDPLPLPLSVAVGAAVQFKGSFTPLGSETATATNTITAWGTDTTTIGGPNASVTNTVTAICTITPCSSCACPCLFAENPRSLRYALRYALR